MIIASMKIEKVSYYGSFIRPEEARNKTIPEFAFIGRSNAGKSSLINFLTGQNIARTSARPGKTQCLNYFKINDAFFLVDLPGYGFAQISKEMRKKIDSILHDFLNNSKNLRCLFILMDSRHPFSSMDEDMILSVTKKKIPMALIFTKTDKLNQREKNILRKKTDSWMSAVFKDAPNIFYTSTIKQKGKEELLEFIQHCLQS